MTAISEPNSGHTPDSLPEATAASFPVSHNQPVMPPPMFMGLTEDRLHERFWAKRGVCVVRRGVDGAKRMADLFLLLGNDGGNVIFDMPRQPGRLLRLSPVARVDLAGNDLRPYGEFAVDADGDGQHAQGAAEAGTESVRHLRRHYGHSRGDSVLLTSDANLARAWADGISMTKFRAGLRQCLRTRGRAGRLLLGGRLHSQTDGQLAQPSAWLADVVSCGVTPKALGLKLARRPDGFHVASDARIDPQATLIGPAWIGAGCRIGAQGVIVGPAVLWDRIDLEQTWIAPVAKSAATATATGQTEGLTYARGKTKRLFDIAFALFALTLTLPLYPLIILAILLEDGWPIFFSQKRQGLDGREFGCVKFRSMYRDAEAVKARLAARNQADGPQFFIDNDPRITRVGRFIRRANLDELPQFWNVLKGDMSIVGPRPSPDRENQFCPEWRYARLSVRPGITGLWQVHRSRKAGCDFQEWIRFDILYADRASLKLDMIILVRTVVMLRWMLRFWRI